MELTHLPNKPGRPGAFWEDRGPAVAAAPKWGPLETFAKIDVWPVADLSDV